MKHFNVQGFNNYKGINENIYATNAKKAIELILNKYNFSFNGITKLTTKENEILLNNGIEPYTKIDFIVENLDSNNPTVGIGSYNIN